MAARGLRAVSSLPALHSAGLPSLYRGVAAQAPAVGAGSLSPCLAGPARPLLCPSWVPT